MRQLTIQQKNKVRAGRKLPHDTRFCATFDHCYFRECVDPANDLRLTARYCTFDRCRAKFSNLMMLCMGTRFQDCDLQGLQGSVRPYGSQFVGCNLGGANLSLDIPLTDKAPRPLFVRCEMDWTEITFNLSLAGPHMTEADIFDLYFEDCDFSSPHNQDLEATKPKIRIAYS